MNDHANLPAGPELDRLIAEKVMGWTFEAELGNYWLEDGTDVCRVLIGGHEYWRPSTNIAHAWEVVEHLRPDKIIRLSDDVDRWVAFFVFAGWRGQFNAPTAPLAICRAALAAVSDS